MPIPADFSYSGWQKVKRVSLGSLVLILLIGLFWGLNWPAVKTLLGAFPPLGLRGFGFTLGALMLFVLAALRGERLAVPRAELGPLILAGLLTVFGFNVLTAFGQLVTETGKAAIVAFTMPVWAALLAIPVLGEALTRGTLLALALGLAGLAVLLGGDFAGFRAAPLGPLIMLGAALSWAAGTVCLKARAWSCGPLARTAWMVAASALVTLPLVLVFEGPAWAALPAPPISILAVLAYHVLFPVVFCYAAWSVLVQRLPASVAAVATLLIPVVGVLSAAWLLGDSLPGYKLLALLLVLSAIAFALRLRPLPTAA